MVGAAAAPCLRFLEGAQLHGDRFQAVPALAGDILFEHIPAGLAFGTFAVRTLEAGSQGSLFLLQALQAPFQQCLLLRCKVGAERFASLPQVGHL